MFAVIGLAAGKASAQLSPGKLSRAHAEIDSSRDCLKCHAKGKGVTADLCLSCHTLLDERIEAGAGLHARPDYQRCETCHIEHHGRDFELIWWGKAGVKSPPGGWQMEHFDHAEAGYPLTGAHQVACRECHQATRIVEPRRLLAAGKNLDRTFLGLETACASCHQDPHRGQMAPRGCAECHGDDAWQPASGFDHDRTDFPLDGRHLQAECSDCHVTETDDDGDWVRYDGTPTACSDCHQDPHRGRLGRDCAACHTTADWQRVDRERFNHDLTRFPLRGLHTRVDCASCHRGVAPEGHERNQRFRIAGFDDCATCHADVHVGQFRERGDVSSAPVPGDSSAPVPGDSSAPVPGDAACSDCHDVNGFIPSRFDIADHAETRFLLDAAHRAVPCISCHVQVATAELVARGVALAAADAPPTARIFRIEETACADCHRDPHAGTADAYLGEAGCKSWHDGNDWQAVSFDHGATGFDLEGAHRTVACAECHGVTFAPVPGDVTGRGTDEVTLSFGGAPTACRDCHDDPHLGQFDLPAAPAACRGCHSLEGWRPALFDHGRDSRFPLEGAHARAECGACHLPEMVEGLEVVRYKPLPTACSGCHKAPPVALPATEGAGTDPEGSLR